MCGNFLFDGYYFPIPVEFDRYSGVPNVLLEIEDKKYLVTFDLGSDIAIYLNKSILEKLDKKTQGVARYLDLKGGKHETPRYTLPSARINGYTARHLETRQESDSFLISTAIYDDTGRTQEEIMSHDNGSIGRDFFSNKNIFLDFPNSNVILCKSLKELTKRGYQTEKFIAVPFQITRGGFIFNVEMDQGPLRFIIDTGSTGTIVRSTFIEGEISNKIRFGMPVFSTSKFVMNGTDFGSFDFHLLDMKGAAAFSDGILGMDFLKHHSIFLDLKKQIAYIDKISR